MTPSHTGTVLSSVFVCTCPRASACVESAVGNACPFDTRRLRSASRTEKNKQKWYFLRVAKFLLISTFCGVLRVSRRTSLSHRGLLSESTISNLPHSECLPKVLDLLVIKKTSPYNLSAVSSPTFGVLSRRLFWRPVSSF